MNKSCNFGTVEKYSNRKKQMEQKGLTLEDLARRDKEWSGRYRGKLDFNSVEN